MKLEILFYLLHSLFLIFCSTDSTKIHDHVLCRECGRDITDLDNLNNIVSPHAVVQRNSSSLSDSALVVQTLVNPAGISFPVVTFEKAGCLTQGKWSDDDTWFPGYYWSPCYCPQCQSHIGWAFKKNIKEGKVDFFAIIESSILPEKFVDNLIAVPKSYNAR